MLIGAGFIYLTVAGSKIQEITTEIEISASPERVWRILSDINNWQEWSPIIKESYGIASVGSELTITMIGKEKSKDGPKYNPVITDFEEPSYFRWRAYMLTGFIFTNYKIFELKKNQYWNTINSQRII